ncbi:MAG: universal stress protein UspA [Planctomycetaceae bacterium]|nr:universal stress protein UspA [Planctomycetaceae bacterium]
MAVPPLVAGPGGRCRTNLRETRGRLTESSSMLSSWKDIAVFLDATTAGRRIGEQAAALARHHSAYLVGVYGLARDSQSIAEGFVRGRSAIRRVVSAHQRHDEQQTLLAARHFATLTQKQGLGSEFRIAWRDNGDCETTLRTLHVDLIVLAFPQLAELPAGWSAEQVLWTTGTPVLLVPASWAEKTVENSVMICWNASRQARRAVNDAMPFLHAAQTVTVLVIDGDRDPGRFGAKPGNDVVQHLAHHGIASTLRLAEAHGKPKVDVILDEATQSAADLLVMGAYSRAPTSEMLFGGITRSLLSRVPLPLMISR